MISTEYYKRNHLIINCQGNPEEISSTFLKVFDELNLEENRPLYITTTLNTLGHVGIATYFFEKECDCPNSKKLEKILEEAKFTGDVQIRKIVKNEKGVYELKPSYINSFSKGKYSY